MLCAGKVVSKQELTERMYDEDLEPQRNVIEVHVAQLCRKLDPNEDLEPIETVRGCYGHGEERNMATRSGAAARSGLLATSLLVSVVGAETAMSATGTVDCEAEFIRLMEDTHTYPDLGSRTKRLEQLGAQCKGSGIYEARLGYFYAQAGRFEEARQIVLAGLKTEGGDQKELRLALANIEFRQGRLAESDRLAAALIKDFADWNGGYLSLGETRLVQHRFEEGIQNTYDLGQRLTNVRLVLA